MRELVFNNICGPPGGLWFAAGRRAVRPEMCGGGFDQVLDVPRGTTRVAVVALAKPRADSFDIKPDGNLVDIDRGLDWDFQKWLKRAYDAGERYAHVEIIQ